MEDPPATLSISLADQGCQAVRSQPVQHNDFHVVVGLGSCIRPNMRPRNGVGMTVPNGVAQDVYVNESCFVRRAGVVAINTEPEENTHGFEVRVVARRLPNSIVSPVTAAFVIQGPGVLLKGPGALLKGPGALLKGPGALLKGPGAL